MAQNIYDDPKFFAGYTTLRRQKIGLDGAPEWPRLRAMLPPLAGARVADLGCGFGWFARWARENGAASVLGLDLSENMLARARRDTEDPAIAYRRADLDTLDLAPGAFDLVYSSLAFHYVGDFPKLVAAIHHSLVPGGALVFSIEHPIYMAAGKIDWIDGPGGRKTWPVYDYGIEGERRTDWFADGVLKFHRTLATTLNTLIAAGFTIAKIDEYAPTPDEAAADPSLREELDRPGLLLVSARR